MKLALAALGAPLLLVPSAFGADARIRPGKGIGKVDLGMTLAQVKRAMGPHDLARSRRLGPTQRRLELQWWIGLRGHSYTVALRGHGNDLRVTLVMTDVPSERTAGGIGPGVGLQRVRTSYPNVLCTVYGMFNGLRERILVHRGGRETAFAIGSDSGTRDEYVVAVAIRLRPERPPVYEATTRC